MLSSKVSEIIASPTLYEKTTGAKEATEWLKQQAEQYPDNKVIQWALHVYREKEWNGLSEDEQDGEVRILKQLIQ